jgi:hypothetical protein
MSQKRILMICGSLNQTTMMHQISRHLQQHACYFTPYYSDGFVETLRKAGLLEFTILGGRARQQTEQYLFQHRLTVDYAGTGRSYDLVFTCSDLIVPENIRQKNIVLVQEGMTDPENMVYRLTRALGLPRYLANTAMTGLSHAYGKFCVASEGHKELFRQKGIPQEKMVVTGIPNFDHAEQYRNNDFPYRNYVLVATSHLRETWKYENRKKFLHQASALADGRPMIFKLHPNENATRARREIQQWVPGHMVLQEGNTNHMIANCQALVTRYSSVLLTALALGKPVYSDLEDDFIRNLTPLQNGGTSARHIARIGESFLE